MAALGAGICTTTRYLQLLGQKPIVSRPIMATFDEDHPLLTGVISSTKPLPSHVVNFYD